MFFLRVLKLENHPWVWDNPPKVIAAIRDQTPPARLADPPIQGYPHPALHVGEGQARLFEHNIKPKHYRV